MKITNQEWTELTKKVDLLGDQNTRHENRLNRHSERLDNLEDQGLQLPIQIQAAITDSLKPVMDSITELSKENTKLREELTRTQNDKYKTAYDSNQKIIWALVGLIITYLGTLLLNNIFV